MTQKIPPSLKIVEQQPDLPQIKRSTKRRNAIIVEHPFQISSQFQKYVNEQGTQSSLGSAGSVPSVKLINEYSQQ